MEVLKTITQSLVHLEPASKVFKILIRKPQKKGSTLNEALCLIYVTIYSHAFVVMILC